MSPNNRDRDRKGPQLILPGAPEPEDEMPGFDEQIVEMVSQQALQLVAANIAFAALAGEVARLSGDSAGFADRLRESSAAILAAMEIPADEPDLTTMFRETVTDNITLIFELLERGKRK